jgi:hypothetical protein
MNVRITQNGTPLFWAPEGHGATAAFHAFRHYGQRGSRRMFVMAARSPKRMNTLIEWTRDVSRVCAGPEGTRLRRMSALTKPSPTSVFEGAIGSIVEVPFSRVAAQRSSHAPVLDHTVYIS